MVQPIGRAPERRHCEVVKDSTKILLLMLSPVLLFASIVLVYGGASMILSIDRFSTRKAPGFSEAKFATIKVGMQSNDVVALLGSPLMQLPKSKRSRPEWEGMGPLEEWSYTLPNEIVDGMGHWNFRALLVLNGTVVEIKKHIGIHH